jgi:hypothetical protein
MPVATYIEVYLYGSLARERRRCGIVWAQLILRLQRKEMCALLSDVGHFSTVEPDDLVFLASHRSSDSAKDLLLTLFDINT